MKYEELLEGIRKFEELYWFGEFIYFKAIEELKEIQTDISKLTKNHVEKIIKIFLIQWGRMGRTIERKEVDWDKLTTQIRRSTKYFQKLTNKQLLTINFTNEDMTGAIVKCYKSARIKFVGPTAISKILHLFNPDLFVMWDNDIVKKYHNINANISGNAEGYLSFLKEMKTQIEEAIIPESKATGSSTSQMINHVCKNLVSQKLGEKYNKKTIAKLVDEYNWITTREQVSIAS